MLHVVTVHFASPRWIEIQTRHLREHISVPYTTWTSLERVDPVYGSHFDRVFEQRGRHPGKLNHLAMEIAHEAPAEDLLMFLDGDAFPIADPMGLIEDGLRRAPLIAVRRAENVNDPQPHPCFCVTTVGTWRELRGDWSGGYTWPGHRGKLVTDVGANLLRALQLSETPWVQVLRSNRVDLDPLFFGIYGDVIYHHGAGFRPGELSRAYLDRAPRPIRAGGLLRPLTRRVNQRRRRMWERRTQRRYLAHSEQIYDSISQGGTDWLNALR
jgi:hypothetical protein